jgi:hypothetical protein
MCKGASSLNPQQDWIDEVVRRQDNIDPIRRIPNGAYFHGALIKGNLRLNGPQRIGAGMLGLFILLYGFFGIYEIVCDVRSWKLNNLDPIAFVLTPFSLWIGWKIVLNALVNKPAMDDSPQNKTSENPS